jgi:hypothetical protein
MEIEHKCAPFVTRLSAWLALRSSLDSTIRAIGSVIIGGRRLAAVAAVLGQLSVLCFQGVLPRPQRVIRSATASGFSLAIWINASRLGHMPSPSRKGYLISHSASRFFVFFAPPPLLEPSLNPPHGPEQFVIVDGAANQLGTGGASEPVACRAGGLQFIGASLRRLLGGERLPLALARSREGRRIG